MPMAVTVFHLLLFFSCISVTQADNLPETVELLQFSACYGALFSNIITASCPTGSTIAVQTVQVGSKVKTLGCASLNGEGACCLKNESSDCLFPFQQPIYQEQCNGKETCVTPASRDIIQGNCDTSVYTNPTHYMVMELFCIPTQRISSICSSSSVTIAGEMLYLWNRNYMYTTSEVNRTIPASDTDCGCAVVADECSATIGVYVIDMRLESNSEGCQQNITITDADTSKVLTCSDNNEFSISRIFSSTSNEIDIQLYNSLPIDGGYFWIGFQASSSTVQLSLQCPKQTQQTCSTITTTTTTTPTTTTATTTTTTPTVTTPTVTTTTTTQSPTTVTTTSPTTTTVTPSSTTTTSPNVTTMTPSTTTAAPTDTTTATPDTTTASPSDSTTATPSVTTSTTTDTTTTTTPPLTSSAPGVGASQSDSAGSSSLAFIAGVCASVLLIILTVAGIIFFLKCVRGRKKVQPSDLETDLSDGGEGSSVSRHVPEGSPDHSPPNTDHDTDQFLDKPLSIPFPRSNSFLPPLSTSLVLNNKTKNSFGPRMSVTRNIPEVVKDLPVHTAEKRVDSPVPTFKLSTKMVLEDEVLQEALVATAIVGPTTIAKIKSKQRRKRSKRSNANRTQSNTTIQRRPSPVHDKPSVRKSLNHKGKVKKTKKATKTITSGSAKLKKQEEETMWYVKRPGWVM